MDEGLLKPGDVLNNTYRIEELVGEGGTGEVYRAVNTASQRTVAIKILKAQFSQDPKFIDLMRRELLHNVSDDAVVRYYDLLRASEEQGGLYFLVMDFIEGPSMADLMRKGPVPVDTLMVLAKRVTQGLAACHLAKIFHRDISPDNIILRDGNPAGATLIDFGIAKDVRPDAKTVVGGGFAGKYEYAAPEQLDGLADARSDIYSFGMTLLAAARGESPKLGTSFLEIVKAKHAEVDTAGVGEPLRALVDSMVRPQPEDRPQSAAALLGMIGGGTAATGQAPIESLLAPEDGDSPQPRSEPKKSVAKKGKGGLVAAVLALAAIAGGAYYATGPGKEVVAGLIGGPGIAAASPYTFTASLTPDSADVVGFAPSVDIASRLSDTINDRLEARSKSISIKAASGVPNEAWQSTVTAMTAELNKLDQGSLEFRDDQITLEGRAPTDEAKRRISEAANRIADNGGYRLAVLLSVPEPEGSSAAELAARQAEANRIAAEKAEAERLAAQKAEDERIAAEKAEADRLEAERIAAAESEEERRALEQQAADRAAREREEAQERQAERDRLAEEQRLADAKAKREEEERLAKAEADAKAEAERLAREEAEREAQEAERLAQEEADRLEKADAERAAREKEEQQRLVALEGQRLPVRTVDAVLDPLRTCGPLEAKPAGSRGFDATETIRVTGFVPSEDALSEIRDKLEAVAGSRNVDTTDVQVLNASVCLVTNVMPKRQVGPAKLVYYSAKTGEVVDGDALKPDDQAVMYFEAPEDLEGNLYVFLTDNEFNTIHLQPMQTKPETLLSKIGTVKDGIRRVQLTWPLAQGSRRQPVLAFTEPYGIAKAFVVVTDGTELFQHLRAGVEDTRELAPDLIKRLAEARFNGRIASHLQRLILVDED